MFLVPFFLLFFNVELRAADDLNGFNGTQTTEVDGFIVTVRDIVDLLNHTAPDTTFIPSKRAIAGAASVAVVFGAVSMSLLNSCPRDESIFDLNADVCRCWGGIFSGAAA